MVKTIQEFVENKQTFIDRLSKVVGSSLYDAHFTGADMGNLVVMEDSDQCRIYEMLYLQSCHFVPGRLPGIGFAVGDYVEHEGKNYIAYKLNTAMIEMSFMQVFRSYESMLDKWNAIADDVSKKNISLNTSLRESETENPLLSVTFEGYAGWEYVGTPSSKYVSTLKELVASETLNEHQLQLANEILSSCEPFANIADDMYKLRGKLECKGVPRMEDGYVGMSSPAASGGVSWYFTTSEDLERTVPSENNFLMLAGNVGKSSIVHIGGGFHKGNMMTFVTPRGFINEAQQIVDTSLADEWKNFYKVALRNKADKIFEKYMQWNEIVLPHLKPLVKSSIPKMVSDRVLGINTNVVSDEDGKALIEPIVSRSYLEKNLSFIQDNFQEVTELQYDGVLGEHFRGYCDYPSVFGKQNLN